MGTQTIKAQVYIAPTNGRSNILLVVTDMMNHRERIKGKLELHDSPHPKSDYFLPQHFYFIVKEEIKVGEPCLISGMVDGKLKVKPNKPTPAQLVWLQWFNECGWRSEVCYVLESAQRIVIEEMKKTRQLMDEIKKPG